MNNATIHDEILTCGSAQYCTLHRPYVIDIMYIYMYGHFCLTTDGISSNIWFSPYTVTPPYVSITRSQPYANAGASFTLTCHVQFPSAPTSPVQIWWANSTDFILNSTAVQDSRTLHTLDFTIAQLKASDGGLYKCGIAVAKYVTSSNTTVIVQGELSQYVAMLFIQCT